MKTALKIFGFAILVSAFYGYVGHMVPQKVTYPPEETEFGAELTTAELVEIGGEIVGGKGTCLVCHTIGESGGSLRFPDLGGIGARAATMREGMDGVEYLAESLYEPNAFIVEGFLPGMPNIGSPPIDLSDQEILAVIAYLESLGGTPSVTMDTELRWQSDEGTTTTQPAAGPASTTDVEPRGGEEIFTTFMCNTCHSIDDATPLVGPSLYDLGARMSKAEIYEAVMDPDATVAEGFAGGVMQSTLQATGFYTRTTSAEVKALVDWLAERQGN